ncbi:MAG: M16 family metallopeptidase [Paracoccus sp. (in: a-proteobacteria)]
MSILRAISLFLASLIALPAAATTDIQEVTSPSGIKAWLVEDHSIPFTALSIAFRGGASLDAPGKRGAINLMTHTLEEGADDMDAVQFAAATESLGARISFDVGDDALTVDAQLLSENREEAAGLIAAALTRPSFSEDAVMRVKGQVLSIIRTEDNDPNAIAGKALARSVWGAHPYGSSISGTAETVSSLGPQDMVEAKNRVIARDRVIVGASGDITAEELGALVDRILGELPETGTISLPGYAEFMAKGGVEVIDWDSPQTVVLFAQPGLALDHPDYFAAVIADHILGGGGFSSRLMTEIREKRGLSYGVYTSLVNLVNGASWQGKMASSNASAAKAVDLVRAEWKRMSEGVSDKELADAKTYLTGEYPLRWNGNGQIAGILAGMQLIGLPIDYPRTRNQQVEAVTAEDVARITRDRLQADQLYFVLVGRPEGVTQ